MLGQQKASVVRVRQVCGVGFRSRLVCRVWKGQEGVDHYEEGVFIPFVK